MGQFVIIRCQNPHLSITAWSEWAAPTTKSGYWFPSMSTPPANEKPKLLISRSYIKEIAKQTVTKIEIFF